MADDGLQYDVMVERALRGVLREALIYVAENGLPGEHHFYITFRTDHPEVEIPDHLHERYPNEMTIVLQHQFWNLEIEEERFQVSLSFSDEPQELSIPFESVIAFADPSVRFGLQFDSGLEEDEEDEDTAEVEAEPPVEQDASPEAVVREIRDEDRRRSEGDKIEDQGDAERPDGEAEIVTLDTFRKK